MGWLFGLFLMAIGQAGVLFSWKIMNEVRQWER